MNNGTGWNELGGLYFTQLLYARDGGTMFHENVLVSQKNPIASFPAECVDFGYFDRWRRRGHSLPALLSGFHNDKSKLQPAFLPI